MSASTTQPSELILARLRDPHASSEQFSSDELRKIYLDKVCFGNGVMGCLMFGLSAYLAGLVADHTHLSTGGVVVAFLVILFILVGAWHAGMGWLFGTMSHDAAFARVQEWAVAHAPRSSGVILASAIGKLFFPLLIVGVLEAAAMTLPDKSRHEAEIRQAVTAAINSADAKTGDQAISKAAAWVLNTTFKDDRSVSYIDFLDYRYQKFGVFSIVTDKNGALVSIGAFNQVYVRDLSGATHG